MVEGTMGSHHKERSTKMNKHNMLCAGIDTGKRKLEVALTSGLRLQIDNNAEGHAALSGWLRKHRIKRVGIEASGGYEREVVAQLRRWRFVVVVFQPAQVRAYAKFHLQRAKNDKIDAALIALCTADVRKIHAPPDARLIPLAERLTFMEQITEDMARAKNRHESCRDPRTKRHWEAEIARLKGVLRIELKALVADIRQHSDLIASVDGLGIRTALAIAVRMPEIGRVTREQAAALVGLAPFDHDSGDQVGVRHIEGGRERLRKALYTAALPAVFLWNHQLKLMYRRLIAAGKPHKLALVACARKLLIYANTVVERGTSWTSLRAAA
jgi:transposase